MTILFKKELLLNKSSINHELLDTDDKDIAHYFSKLHPLQDISLQDIQQKIQNNSFSLSDLLETTLGWISLFMASFSVLFYLTFLSFIGLPLNHTTVFINTFTFFSGFLIFSSSFHLYLFTFKLPFLRRKAFNYKQFIQQFLETDTLSFFKNIQDDLFLQLEKKNIQFSHPHIYNYIYQSITDLEEHYNELMIRLNSPKFKSFKESPFIGFIYHYENLIKNIHHVNDIQIINSDT